MSSSQKQDSQEQKTFIRDFTNSTRFYEKVYDDGDTFNLKQYAAAIFPAHFHASAEIYFVLGGEVEVTVNGTKQVLKKNNALFVNSLEIHSYGVEKWANVLCMQIGARFMKPFYEMFKGAGIQNFLLKSDYNEELSEVMMHAYSAYVSRTLNDFDRLTLTCEVISAIIRGYGVTEKYYDDNRMHAIIKYIHENYHLYDLGLKHLAKHFSYSEVTISRFFNNILKINIRSYINIVRISNAKHMIAERKKTGMKMEEIASKCGFYNITTFYRVLKEFG